MINELQTIQNAAAIQNAKNRAKLPRHFESGAIDERKFQFEVSSRSVSSSFGRRHSKLLQIKVTFKVSSSSLGGFRLIFNLALAIYFV